MKRKTRALKVAVGIILVKERIQQYYVQTNKLEEDLKEFKREHGYCIARPYCMNITAKDALSCSECLKASSNPRYKKVLSPYGKLRAKEKFEEREKKKKEKTRAKKAA